MLSYTTFPSLVIVDSRNEIIWAKILPSIQLFSWHVTRIMDKYQILPLSTAYALALHVSVPLMIQSGRNVGRPWALVMSPFSTISSSICKARQAKSLRPILTQTSPTKTSIFAFTISSNPSLASFSRLLISFSLSWPSKSASLCITKPNYSVSSPTFFLQMYNPCGGGSPYTYPYDLQWIVSTPIYCQLSM